MNAITTRWETFAQRKRWEARGASFVAKVKATKAVWFPPTPEETGKRTTKRTVATAKKATKRPASKATSAATKSTRSPKKATGASRGKKA